MATVTLGAGKAALKVSPIGFGAMNIIGVYGNKTSVEDGVKLLRKGYDEGVRHIDTAQIYQSPNEDGTIYYSESVVGEFLKTLSEEERKDVTVATKLFPQAAIDENGKFSFKLYKDATVASAERLGVKTIDLYYFHRMIPASAAPLSEWMGAAVKLIDEGLIQRIGLSEASPEALEAAHKIYPITCIQQEWSIFARDLEDELVPLCKKLNIGIVSYSPVARGLLAGSIKREDVQNDWRAKLPWFSEENLEANAKILEDINGMAEQKGCSVSQLCIAWVMAKGSVPIPGTTKEKNLVDNMNAMKVKLSEEEIKKLGDLGKKVKGLRADESYMQNTFQSQKVEI